MSFKIVTTTLSAAVAAGGTFTLSYPASTDEDSYASFGHKAIGIGNVMSSPADFTLTFGTANITFTYGAGKTTMPAGTIVNVELNLPGVNEGPVAEDVPLSYAGVSELHMRKINLGSPLVADVNLICESQDLPAGGAATLTVAAGVDLATGLGGAPFGRCVNVDSGEATTGVVTITGTDYLGNAIAENITLNGTTVVQGVKAFATVTAVSVSADSGAGFIVGTNTVLGLPIFIEDVDEWVTELLDGVTATAGTFVAGVSGVPTAITGDVRGTYAPNSAPNGARNFVLYMSLQDPAYTGQAQFAG